MRGCFGEMTADGFDAASVLPGKLCVGLLANAVRLPEGVGVKLAAAAETLVAGGAFVALFAITGSVLLDLYLSRKKAFFCVQRLSTPESLTA
ncbi:hypothetical protein ACFFOT_12210 [Cardiobacterium valvarum]|uniref:hypothetical protein n=1 Tax=Cardiobacterium valvarum TaxID=194702 RepID=UPI001582CEB3|nr:hypothetical protein [Cardiobacterium valvarum]